MPAFATGPLQNIGIPPAATVVAVLSNVNPTQAANVELILLTGTVSTTGSSPIPLAHQLFTVPPSKVVTKTFSVVGTPGYAFEFNVSGTAPGDLLIESFSFAADGTVVAANRVLQSELSAISGVTAIP